MSTFNIFIYWKGRKFDGPQGCTFEGEKRLIKIEKGVSYSTLKKKIATKLKLQSHETISSLTYRFPVARDNSIYTALEIVDDDDVDCMISTFEQRSSLTMLELYVEVAIAGSSLTPIGHFNHSAVPFADHHRANAPISDEDENENYIRDLLSEENEDDEGEIPYGDSSESDAELDSPAIAVSPVASSLHIREQLSRQEG